ncbi:hypothetical protein ONZ43_g4415 [Nemania bipapillata]|uniref:Uncharacterized protein n=1 Tax=Nemania bipapillata TaxID=110536 RepID=A0ACC2IMZ0_9PEZI|nr:hypothetical protein ONZ43_g4415 [Nemania bipapillata]
MTVGLKDLEDAVCNIVQIIKQIPELKTLRLAVIGDLALWHYLPNHRQTDKINFITSFGVPRRLYKTLLQHTNTPFTRCGKRLFYRNVKGRDIQIQFAPFWNFPYLPESVQYVHSIPYGKVPYLYLMDLFRFMLNSSLSSMATGAKRQEAGDDALALMRHDKASHHRTHEYALAVDEHIRRLDVVFDTRAMLNFSRQQEILAEYLFRSKQLTVSPIMHSPPLHF